MRDLEFISPSQRIPADPAYPADPADPGPEVQLGPSLPHAPGARMTVVKQTPSNNFLKYSVLATERGALLIENAHPKHALRCAGEVWELQQGGQTWCPLEGCQGSCLRTKAHLSEQHVAFRTFLRLVFVCSALVLAQQF